MSRPNSKSIETGETEDTSASADRPASEAAPPKSRRKRLIFGVVGLVLVAGLADVGFGYWTTGRFMVETDDAYVTADTTLISSRVQGYVVEVAVNHNEQVKAGQVLLRLDDGDYRIALDTAKERVRTADQTIARIGAQIAAAEAGVVQAQAQQAVAQAQLTAAKRAYDRAHQLLATNVVSQAQLDQATELLDTTTASLASAAAAIRNAEAQVGVLHAQQAEAKGTKHELELAVAQAQRNLDLTVLRAPTDGTVGNMSVEIGDLVTAGTRLAALVPMNTLYVEANFKETQIADVALGAHVGITFDAIPDKTFEGRVESISPATGSVFSLLPADNATGNFTKIVQRIPVRISIPETALVVGNLRAGLSAVVEVDKRSGTPHAKMVQAE
ncbi:HlyD family secretion protein (plasmid) [Pseudorhodobacter turbinis]|uniref:HlyD family secretion protein n=1 Tax=Pseudorhodobacter turbinis TaxID=2500533 RepID=A0A4P8EKP1_9RHOB|nr:HlyD family secretion protein [Pseudorhodobacter turbinis]QCO57608.1 HlyD family secretion protein [Pseudorhodobacter turbinis]